MRLATRAFDAGRDRAREHGLRRAGDVLEQDVTAAGERRDHERDLLVLAEHDGLDVAEQAAGDVGRSAERGGVRCAPLNACHIGHRNRAAGEAA